MKIVLGILLGFGAILLWGLFELQRLPYDPPYDMRTLLGGSEILAVRIAMCVIGVLGVAGLIWLIDSMRSKK